jgi:uncharacterized Ntn-hydrolase superfamily protein
MTFSIVGRLDNALGVAVASKFLSVGAAVPAAAAEIGAIATQAYANLAYRSQGLSLLRTGASAAGTVAELTAADPQRAERQLGVVAATGDGATFTGDECHSWAGGVAGDGYAIQGNILVGPQVVEAMEAAWRAAEGPLAERLLAALKAGDDAGGDRRGRQSAALLVVESGKGYGGTSDVALDLRVDDHVAPVGELARLVRLHEFYFGQPDPTTLLALTGDLADEVGGRVQRLGYADLASWAGVENLEERVVPGHIDPLVLEHLRAAS